MHRYKCLLCLDHDCHTIIRKYCNTLVGSGVVAYGQPSQEAPKNICNNQLMINFYVLSGILIEKFSFQVSCQFNAKSGAIDQLTLGDRLVGHPLVEVITGQERYAKKPGVRDYSLKVSLQLTQGRLRCHLQHATTETMPILSHWTKLLQTSQTSIKQVMHFKLVM